MKGQKEQQQAWRVGKNVRFLRLHFDLTVFGLAAALGLSANHLRLIEASKVNIRKSTALKICNLFDISRTILYGSGFPEKREVENVPAIAKFYTDNKRNLQFFISAKVKNSVTYFVREILLKQKKFFRKGKWKVDDLVKESEREEYERSFESKAISQVVIRLYKSGLLARKDPTEEDKCFRYYEPE